MADRKGHVCSESFPETELQYYIHTVTTAHWCHWLLSFILFVLQAISTSRQSPQVKSCAWLFFTSCQSRVSLVITVSLSDVNSDAEQSFIKFITLCEVFINCVTFKGEINLQMHGIFSNSLCPYSNLNSRCRNKRQGKIFTEKDRLVWSRNKKKVLTGVDNNNNVKTQTQPVRFNNGHCNLCWTEQIIVGSLTNLCMGFMHLFFSRKVTLTNEISKGKGYLQSEVIVEQSNNISRSTSGKAWSTEDITKKDDMTQWEP